ncbi:MAG: hypothetical protein U0S12_08710 [Fimbriimonadales bacterium]
MRAVRWTLYGVFAVALTGVMALLPIVFAHRVDRFRFLEGRSPHQYGVMPHLETLTDTTPMSEFRLYTWKRDYATVLENARRELADMGYKRKPGKAEYWVGPQQTVWLTAAKCETLRDEARAPQNAEWTTVIVDNDAPETWLSKVRVWFAPEW